MQTEKHTATELTEGSWKAESSSLPLALLLAGVELPSQMTESAELMAGLSGQSMVDSSGRDVCLEKAIGE